MTRNSEAVYNSRKHPFLHVYTRAHVVEERRNVFTTMTRNSDALYKFEETSLSAQKLMLQKKDETIPTLRLDIKKALYKIDFCIETHIAFIK